MSLDLHLHVSQLCSGTSLSIPGPVQSAGLPQSLSSLQSTGWRTKKTKITSSNCSSLESGKPSVMKCVCGDVDRANDGSVCVWLHRKKPCKYFDQGRGSCPFGGKCLYLHALPDGSRAEPDQPRKQLGSEGNIRVRAVSVFPSLTGFSLFNNGYWV